MADQPDQPSSIAAKKLKKKGGDIVKLFRGLFKRPNDSASQSNSTKVSVSSFGTHDLVPGNDAGGAEPMASSEYIGSNLVLLTRTY